MTKAREQPLSRRVLRFIRKQGLIPGPGPLVVGVSGGPDSVCLLHILVELQPTLGLGLHVAHLNHLLRGAESDADAEYVSRLAHHLGLAATIDKRDVRGYRAQKRLSLEEAAREVRYAFFAEVAERLGAAAVAVGHTLDDQVETILMHLVRGTGLSGLRGMQPLTVWRQASESQLAVVRPLLQATREETTAYCADHGLSPRSDSSNLWPNQLRNRIRSQLIPLLQSYNPNIGQALVRTADAATRDLACIDQQVSQLWDVVARRKAEGVVVDRERFAGLHPALKRQLLRAILEQLLGGLEDIQSVHIDSLLKALAEPAGKRISLPRGLMFSGDRSHGTIAFVEDGGCPLPILEGEHKLVIPGETLLPGWLVTATVHQHQPEVGDGGRLKAHLDFDAAGEELVVRGRRRGDRFQPLGLDRLKRLQDFMVDAKIPRRWRERVPLVSSPQHIVWVVGWRIDHRARISASTRRILGLEFIRR